MKLHRNFAIINMVDYFWESFVPNFGGKSRVILANQSYKILIFTSLFSGTIIWICYRACLTGELSIAHQKFPFHDLESLSATDWK